MGEIQIEDYIVEWDDEKAEINRRKHKVLFSLAAKVFLDEFKIDEFDEFHSDDEERRKIIGKVENILAVVYTERKEKYRIISARLATKKEKEDYYGQFSYL